MPLNNTKGKQSCCLTLESYFQISYNDTPSSKKRNDIFEHSLYASALCVLHMQFHLILGSSPVQWVIFSPIL